MKPSIDHVEPLINSACYQSTAGHRPLQSYLLSGPTPAADSHNLHLLKYVKIKENFCSGTTLEVVQH